MTFDQREFYMKSLMSYVEQHNESNNENKQTIKQSNEHQKQVKFLRLSYARLRWELLATYLS